MYLYALVYAGYALKRLGNLEVDPARQAAEDHLCIESERGVNRV